MGFFSLNLDFVFGSREHLGNTKAASETNASASIDSLLNYEPLTLSCNDRENYIFFSWKNSRHISIIKIVDLQGRVRGISLLDSHSLYRGT